MNHAEKVLLAHLTEPDSLDILAREAFDTEVIQEIIPTGLIRRILSWCLDEYFANGRKVAPSKEAITETWADQLEQAEIEIEDDTETDSITWAIDQLRSQYVTWKSQQFVTGFAKDITTADPTEKVKVLSERSYDLFSLLQQVTPHRDEMDLHEGLAAALRRYQDRAENGRTMAGMTFGLPLVDEHTFGIHPGEIALMAAGTGVGKTWWGLNTALAEWDAKRKSVVWSLENTLDSAFDRMACLKAKVDYERWQRGELHEGELDRVMFWLDKIENSEHRPVVIHPRKGQRTVVYMVRKSVVLGAQSLIIDQLSHVTPPKEARRFDRRERVGAIMTDLQESMADTVEPLSCLLLHQINREGNKAVKSSGKYEVDHMADSADVERAVDFLFTLYQSQDDKVLGEAVLQLLKGRRVPNKAWRLAWRVGVGDIRVREEITDAS